MRYNPIDTCYKKAIEDYGVIAKIDENQTKVLIREVSDEYGIDYKKIISSNPLQQGNYVYINGVQFLIYDIEPQYSQSIYNIGIFRETKELVLLSYNNKKVQGIVDRNKINIVTTEGITGVYDQYNFIIPTFGNNVSLNNEIAWDGGIYAVISINTTKDNLYIITGKYKDVYDPHVYTISLSQTTTTIVEGGTYQISNVVCKDNGTVVTNPVLTYVSSDVNIATVSASGLVTGVKTGNSEITVSYNGVMATLHLTVNAKPSTPVVSFSYTLSNGANLRVMEGTVINCVRSVDGVADTTYIGTNLAYTLDSIGQTALSQSKITLTKGTTAPSITIRNKQTSSDTVKIMHITVTDSATGTIIVNNLAITLKNSGV